MKMLITGATGFIGRHLAREARKRGHDVVAVSRDPVSAKGALTDTLVYPWNPERDLLPAEALEGVDTVLHLAGESVAKGRWTRKKMARIRDSRVLSTRKVVASFAQRKPNVLVCASAVGFYGDRGDEILREDAPRGGDYLAEVCEEWEREAARAREHGVRWVSLRTGIVLGPDGGALPAMRTPFALNLGGPIAGGRQWMPWIHIDDIVGLYLHAAERPDVSGPVNAVAPSPQRNYDFTKTLGRVLGKWTIVPMPRFMLRLAVGKFAAVLASSQRCEPAAALRSGYAFRYPELEGALRQVLHAPAPR